jgi:glycosyltransferase involved in cell wall biosynthesis
MRRPNDPAVTIVIPARNEARNLEVLLPRLPSVHEVILVDGHSVDDTVGVARRLLSNAVVLTQDRIGKGNAMACGFRAATGDIVVMLDADGSADPDEIPAFVSALRAGADFAKGSRFCSVETAHGGSDDITGLRKAGNAGLGAVANMLFGVRFTDLCYGYNAFWRDILPILDLPQPSAQRNLRMQWGDGFEIETLINCRVAAAGLKITEVPSIERRRIHGTTNLRTFADGARVLRTIAAEYRRRPSHSAPIVPVPRQTSLEPAAFLDPPAAALKFARKIHLDPAEDRFR